MTLKICACLGKCSNSGLFPGTGADERDLAVCAGRRAALRRFLLAGVGFFRAPSISLVVHTSTGRSGGGRSRTGPVYFRVWLRFLAVPLTCLLSSTIFSSRVMCGQEPPCERCLCSAEGQQPPAPVPSRDTHVQRSSLGTVAMVTDLVTANSTN